MRIEPLDTTLTAWRIDYPFYRNGVGDAPIGALGQGSVPLNYFERPQWQDFSFASPFHSYIYDMRNAPFYNGKRPFLQMTYIESGQKRYRETNFEIRHAQNISPSTSFSIDYKSRGTRGLYEWSRTKNQNIAVTVAHTGKRYSYMPVTSTTTSRRRRTAAWWANGRSATRSSRCRRGVPMRLTNAKAENIYRNHAFFHTQSYAIPLQRVTENDFSLADLSAVFIGHSIEYDIWSKTYTDIFGTYTDERGSKDENGNFVATEGHEYYDNWFIHPDASARHALRTEAFEPPVRTGAAVGPQRRDRHHRRRRGVRHPHLLAVRARRLHHRQIPPHAKDQLFRLRVDRRQNQEIRRLGRQHEGLPVGVQRRETCRWAHTSRSKAISAVTP